MFGLRSPGSLLFPRCGGDVRGGVVACSATDRQVRYYSQGVGVIVRGGVVACSASDRQVRYYSPGVGVT